MIIFIILVFIILVIRELSINHNTVEDTSKDEEKENILLIKDYNFQENRIIEYKGEDLKQFIYRPSTLEQFIGQETAKEKIKLVLNKAKNNIKSHIFIDGLKGHGKTTLIKIIAKTLNAKLIEKIGKQLDEENIIDIINEINTSKEQYIILFIDEADTIDPKLCKILNPIVEDFKFNNKRIKPFILACATLNKYVLERKVPDFLDRINNHIKLDRYTVEDLILILKQYKEQLYTDITLSDYIIKIIAENCKYTPRIAISLLEDTITLKNNEIDEIKLMKKVLSLNNIIINGLNNVDIKILNILHQYTKMIGSKLLAMKCALSEKEYLELYEPYLVEMDYINRVPSRLITEKGRKILEKIFL